MAAKIAANFARRVPAGEPFCSSAAPGFDAGSWMRDRCGYPRLEGPRFVCNRSGLVRNIMKVSECPMLTSR